MRKRTRIQIPIEHVKEARRPMPWVIAAVIVAVGMMIARVL